MLQTIDDLKIYFRQDIALNQYITLVQPDIKTIIDFGEQKYFNVVHNLCSIPSDIKSELSDHNIDYETISDFELFIILTRGMGTEETGLFIKDCDLSQLKLIVNSENGEVCLKDDNSPLIIDKLIYMLIVDYVRKLHNIKPKIEKAANKLTKKILIEEDRTKKLANKNKPYTSNILPMISFLTASGFTMETVYKMGIYELTEHVMRVKHIKHVDSLYSGMYSGNLDASKINKSDLNYMKDL